MVEYNKYEEIENELSKLINDGYGLMKLLSNNHSGKQSYLMKNYENNRHKFTFRYQDWYTRSLPVIRYLLPERLDEFERFYHMDGRSYVDKSTYTIEDYIQGVQIDDYVITYVDKIAWYRVRNQVSIVKSAFSSLSSLLANLNELVHANIFNDFLEMADYLQKEGYKDSAAVLAGGTLEEHLRKLSQKNEIATEKEDSRPKKADRLNADLTSANVYSKLDQKNVTAWLDLRNKAAHGKYSYYSKEQVALMIQGIRDFISRYPA
jgi:hypothetical protein